MTKRRIAIFVLIACVLVGSVTFALLAKGDRLHAKARRVWKDHAIAKIEHRLRDRQALESEVARIGHALAATHPAPDAWIGDNVLVMKNGDWIVCQSICSKEDGRIHDLFVGHGSDGKWYYSTFHFCRGKEVLRMEDRPPDSLAQFADAYWLAPFDGRSDDCLKATWTGTEPWGQEKLQVTATSPAR